MAMKVDFHDARARMDEVIDAVQHGRQVILELFGEPIGSMRLLEDGVTIPRDAVESIVRHCLDMMEERLRSSTRLPDWLGN